MTMEANTGDLVRVLTDLVAREGLDRWHDVVRDLAFARRTYDRNPLVEESADAINGLDTFYSTACSDYLSETAATEDMATVAA